MTTRTTETTEIVETATEAALEALLWTGTAADGTALDTKHTIDSVGWTERRRVRIAFEAFIGRCALRGVSRRALDEFGAAELGRLWVLSSNRHGVGFWSEAEDDLGDVLTELACEGGEIELFEGTDGSLYALI